MDLGVADRTGSCPNRLCRDGFRYEGSAWRSQRVQVGWGHRLAGGAEL